MRIKEHKRAIIGIRKDEVFGRKKKSDFEIEDAVNNNNDKLYCKSLSLMNTFLKVNDFVDTVIFTRKKTNSIKDINNILKHKSIVSLVFKIEVYSMSFFDKKVIGLILKDDWLSILNNRIKYNVFFKEAEKGVYVYINKY